MKFEPKDKGRAVFRLCFKIGQCGDFQSGLDLAKTAKVAPYKKKKVLLFVWSNKFGQNLSRQHS